MAQEAIKSNNKRLVDAVVRMQVEHASDVKSGDERVENLPLIGVTCSTGWECYAIVQELCATRRFRVRAMYRTPGTHAEKRLKKLLQETSVPGLLTLRPHTDLNSAQVLTEAFADCNGVVLYVTANTSVAGKVNNHGNDPVGGRAVVMRQILAIDSALKGNPSVKQVVTLAFPTDKVRGILPDAPEAPWWIQQRNVISDFLRGQGHNVTCIRRPGYYYAMHRVDYTNVASFRGETRMSKVMIRENYMPGIMAPDFVVNWVDVRDVGKWVGTCFQYPQVFSNENLSIASCVMTGRERAAMAEKVNKHGTKFSYRRFPPLVMRLLALFSDEVVYPLRISQWYNEHANAYDFASEEDLADLDRVHPRWTFEEKLISWGIDEIVPVKQGL